MIRSLLETAGSRRLTTQRDMERKLSLWFDNGDTSLTIRRFTLSEAMNQPFRAELVALSSSDDLDLETFVGRPARLTIASQHLRVLEGIIQRMSLVKADSKGLSTYRLELGPRLWLLQHRRDNRIFQHLSIPDIVRQVLADAKVEATWRIQEGAYPKQEFRVQYEESDFDFVSRLLEEVGISFFFDERSTLVFADRPGDAELRNARLPYFTGEGGAAGEHAFSLELSDEVRPARFELGDQDFRGNPAFALVGQGRVDHETEQDLAIHHYRPGVTWVVTGGPNDTPTADDRGVVRASDAEGTALAQRMLESVRAGKLQVTARVNAYDLAPGTVFAVSRHPHRELHDSRGLLVVSSSFSGTHDGEWNLTVVAYFADHPLRPPMRTARPRIRGMQSAIVVGPPGEEIHTDEFGRVRVQFHWDRQGQRDHMSSCWMRVNQGWAGAGQGMIVLPRIGQEVFVAFLDGDPEQPIVMGRVFSQSAPVPHALPANKTRSAWRSATSPANGGYNEIMMEDASGNELLQMHAQKDMQKRVNNSSMESIGNALSTVIGATKDLLVGTHRRTTIGQTDLKTVGMMYRVEVPPPPMVPGAMSLSAGAAAEAKPPTAQTWKHGDALLEADNSKVQLTKNIDLTTDGDITIKAKGTITIVGQIIHLNP